ncbi:MAG: M2 family metallopeptidase, partial [Vicinamibacteria bacterium]|nr:M2 family metallopeptidase [Vicinamibacteria bacterium]
MTTRPACLALLLLLPSFSNPSVAQDMAIKPKTAADAKAFTDKAEKELFALANAASRADWVKATYITDDTEAISAEATQRYTEAAVAAAKKAASFDGVKVAPDVARKLNLLKVALVTPAPTGSIESKEVATLANRLEGTYGKGKYTRTTKEGKQETLDLAQLSDILVRSRDPKEMEEAWAGWHSIARPMKKDFQRFVELQNKGARQLGFKDTGALWRSKYDMAPDAFAREVDRLWEQMKPLYLSLHAYVRKRLSATYGPGVVPEKGPIPAHLLGNMWAQQWGNIEPLVAPKDTDPGFDLTARLKEKKIDELEMVRYGERFFTSLGFDPLPQTFWDRSLFVKPKDRDVVCHASAWDVDNDNDLRIKMCIEITGEDFSTIHHELGHNFYQRAYNQKPFLFRDSANDGFHEAIGDTIALSITPSYLKQLGLIDQEPDPSKDIGLLLRMALDKIAFLPFGLLVDQYRWKIFSGEITPAEYNQAWWDLRLKYQGIAPPRTRTEDDFDAAAKYHVAANVPYTRYFLAHIQQFQFHRALCRVAGQSGPLNRCSIYGSKAAGAKLASMLAMGVSKPWPDAMEALTGSPQMDATAILDYFAPLQKWL